MNIRDNYKDVAIEMIARPNTEEAETQSRKGWCSVIHGFLIVTGTCDIELALEFVEFVKSTPHGGRRVD